MKASATVFVPLLGLYPFAAAKGHGSFVTFSLTTTPDAPREEYFIWIFMCGWKLRQSGEELAHCESSDDEIMAAVARLNGARLEQLVLHEYVTPEGLRYGASLVFEERLIMRLYQYEGCSPEEELFKMCDATGTWISYLADGTIEKTIKECQETP